MCINYNKGFMKPYQCDKEDLNKIKIVFNAMWSFGFKYVLFSLRRTKNIQFQLDNWKVTVWKGSSAKLSSWGPYNKLCKNQLLFVTNWIFFISKKIHTSLLPLCLLTLFIHQTHVPHHKAKCTNLHITSLHMVKWSRKRLCV